MLLQIISSCSIINHKGFSLPLQNFKATTRLKTNGYYTSFIDSIGSLNLICFYNNGVALYYEIGCNINQVDSILNAIQKKKASRSSDIESGSYSVIGNVITIETLSSVHYGNYKVRKFKGNILNENQINIISESIFNEYNLTRNLSYVYQESSKPDSINWLMKRKWYN